MTTPYQPVPGRAPEEEAPEHRATRSGDRTAAGSNYGDEGRRSGTSSGAVPDVNVPEAESVAGEEDPGSAEDVVDRPAEPARRR